MEWPLVTRETHDGVVAERDRLQQELAAIAPYLTHLPVAQELHAEVQARLQDPTTTGDIGRIAFMSVLERQVEKGKKELAARYESEHRHELYQQLLTQLEEEEGPEILKEAARRVETDVELAKKLRDSARKELLARAEGRIAENISAEQERVLAGEIERQMELDKLDVEFMFTSKIDLNDKRVTDKIQPNDKVIIYFATDIADKKQKVGLVFTWEEDVNNNLGWVLTRAIKATHSYQSYTEPKTDGIPTNRYVQPGAELANYTEGVTVIKPGILAKGKPLAVSWGTNSGKDKQATVSINKRPEYSGYDQNIGPAKIASIDFETRNPQFV